MRSLCVFVLLVGLLLLGGAGAARFAEPTASTARSAVEYGRTGGEARLVGRRGREADPVPQAGPGEEGTRPEGEITVSIVGPSERPHTLVDRQRLLAQRDTEWQDGGDEVEGMLRDCEDDVANELSGPCGVLLAGREAGEGPDVDGAPWIDPEHGTFEADFRPPYDVEALYVYGGRLVTRAPLTDSATHFVVDPMLVFAGTGEIELTVLRGDTGDAVADVLLEIDAVGRDVSTRTDPDPDGELAVGVRPFRFSDLPAGVYHVRVERPGPPWTFGVATVEVRPGEVTREAITLGPGAFFRMRWFEPNGRPTGNRVTTVQVRDRADRLHFIRVRSAPADPHLLLVDRAPPGPCWLVTSDQRAHRLDPSTVAPGPELVVHLQDWVYVVLAARLETVLPAPLAKRSPSRWKVRDERGVIVESDHLALTSWTRDDDGTFWGWAHLPPGRYHVRWQLTPDLTVEKSFEVPAGVEEIRVNLAPGP